MIATLDGHGRPFVRGMNGTFGGDIVPQELTFEERMSGLTELPGPADAPNAPPLALAPPAVFDLDDFVVLPQAVPFDMTPPGPPDFIDIPMGPAVTTPRSHFDAHDVSPPSVHDWWSAGYQPDLQPFGVSDFLFALF
jgi:hypothetical protein